VAAGLLTLFLVRDKLPFVAKKSDVEATMLQRLHFRKLMSQQKVPTAYLCSN
jgi:hypothetical protein